MNITDFQTQLFAELLYSAVVENGDLSSWSDPGEVLNTFCQVASDGLLTSAEFDFPESARQPVREEIARRNADLEGLMNGLSWDERARADSGQPIERYEGDNSHLANNFPTD